VRGYHCSLKALSSKAGAAEGPERIEVFHGKGDGLAGEQAPFEPVDLAVEVGFFRRPSQLFGFLRAPLFEGFHAGQLGGVALLRLLQLGADLLREAPRFVGRRAPCRCARPCCVRDCAPKKSGTPMPARTMVKRSSRP
jgi:hypothetical protein